MADRRVYNCWVIVRPADDIDGEWVAHCLDLDVVTQGSSPAHALEMAREAAAMVVVEDLNTNRDPLRRRAPEEFWAELYAMVEASSPIDRAGIETIQGAAIIVADMLLEFERRPSQVIGFQTALSVLVADDFLRLKESRP